MRRMSCKGYILKDFLLGIIVFMMLFPVVVKSAEIVSGLNFVDAQLGDELSILQLRRKMIISEYRIYFEVRRTSSVSDTGVSVVS